MIFFIWMTMLIIIKITIIIFNSTVVSSCESYMNDYGTGKQGIFVEIQNYNFFHRCACCHWSSLIDNQLFFWIKLPSQKINSVFADYDDIFYKMKILTWNINGIRGNKGLGLKQLLDSLDADVICLQETKVSSIALIALLFMLLAESSLYRHYCAIFSW